MKRNINIFNNSDDESDSDNSPSRAPITKKKFKIPSIDQIDVQQNSGVAADQDYMSYIPDDDGDGDDDDGLKQNANQPKSVANENKMNKSLFLENNKSVGLTIMERMGYKVGNTLGKSNERAIMEPLKVSVRTGRRGIGGDIKPREYKQEDVEKLKLSLVSSQKQRNDTKEIMRIMKLAFELSGEYDEFLDGKDVEEINMLWKPYVYFMQHQKDKRKVQSKESKSRTLSQYHSSPQDNEIDDPGETLSKLLDYLRERHSYCWYCGVKYANEADLNQHCPGKERSVHLL
ncbi:hypothetical protein JTP64_002028 [Candida tropicalis]|nr:hypothetical protein JTP64_002028 [Candida tropicalis]